MTRLPFNLLSDSPYHPYLNYHFFLSQDRDLDSVIQSDWHYLSYTQTFGLSCFKLNIKETIDTMDPIQRFEETRKYRDDLLLPRNHSQNTLNIPCSYISKNTSWNEHHLWTIYRQLQNCFIVVLSLLSLLWGCNSDGKREDSERWKWR